MLTVPASKLLLLLLLLLSLDISFFAGVAAEDSGSPTNLAETDTEAAAPVVGRSDSGTPGASQDTDTFNAKEHTDWGSYYDPKNIFCGRYVDYLRFGRSQSGEDSLVQE
jgi:hypothetical protein